MLGGVPWLALGAAVAGAISLYFIRYLWPYRGKPGATLFIATIGCEALWTLSYAAALLVHDPALRWLFEVPIWAGINFIGVAFLGFALDYTGRDQLLRSKLMGGIVLVQAAHTAVVATNPFHGVAWSDYRIEPVLGSATVSYTHEPWLFLNATGVILLVAAGSFLLADTFVSYGPLYRGQAAAIAVSPALPGLAFLLWLFEVGGSPPLNLTPLTFPLHLGLDMYAFFRRNMFEQTPASRRVGEQAALDDLGTAVLVVDDGRRIVAANDESRRLFEPGERALLGTPLESLVEDIRLDDDDQTVAVTAGGERRDYAVTTSAIEDAGGSEIGHTIVLQDVTAERQREQRLAVLNRVLRHNLRNDLNVVQGAVDTAADRTDEAAVRELLATASEATAGVIELGEKARTIERVREADRSSEPIRVRELLADVEAGLPDIDGTVEVDVPEDLTLRSDPELVGRIFHNLMENGIEHADGTPRVEVAFAGTSPDGRSATFEIRDNGPGIPEQERRVIEAGEETALEHGSGLGLWLVRWATDSLGGEIEFETDGSGTTARLRLPGVADGGTDG